MNQYDVIVIGTGAANIITDAAQRQGLRIAVIERDRFGGTCLNRGCIPTKIMVTAANVIREIEEARRIGVMADNARLDWDVVSRRLWHKINENSLIKDYYAAFPNVDVYEGTASFTGKKSLHIAMNDGSSREITGDRIFIGVGARTNIPAIPGLEDTGYLTSESLFGDKYPKRPYGSLLIIGGGPIGCEFAHVFSAAGTKVTIVQRNVRLLPKEDEDISAFILKQLTKHGISVRLNQNTLSAYSKNHKKYLLVEDKATGEKTELSADEILVAPGILPMTDLLHLEHTDIRTDSRGFIMTNEFLETSADGIWAIGDVNGQAPFRHKANYEAEILAHNLFSGIQPEHWRWVHYDIVPAVTFTYPEAAHVGLNEAEARKKGLDIEIAINHYSASAKGYAMGLTPGDEDDGFVKLIIDKKTKYILGAHIIGHDASILIQPFVNQLTCGFHTVVPIHDDIASPTAKALRALPLTRNLAPNPVYTFSETMTPHPSLSEVTMWTRYYYEKK